VIHETNNLVLGIIIEGFIAQHCGYNEYHVFIFGGGMQDKSSQVVLITGTSSGIGYACARVLSAESHRVYGTNRASAGDEDNIRLLKMDVTDDASVGSAIQQLLDAEGRLDVVVNNAGMGYGGAVEDTSLKEAKTTIETNFLGVLRVCRAVLPTMRAQSKGLIINISSIGGMVGLPFQGLYSASKYALEGMTKALRAEVKPFGIRVVLINPGDLATSFTKNRRMCQESRSNSVYAKQFKHTLAIIEKNENEGSSPDIVAKTLLKVVRSSRPRPRYIIGNPFERLVVWLLPWLPESVFEWGVSQYYGM
jgi:NAD(P)-dependent dehydrogenase (short-subunit alcohol dehydrogenase family)